MKITAIKKSCLLLLLIGLLLVIYIKGHILFPEVKTISKIECVPSKGSKEDEFPLDAAGTIDNLYLAPIRLDNTLEEYDNLMLIKKEEALNIINNDASEKEKALASLKPYIDKKGSFSGYLVDGIEQTNLAYIAGLRNGDIIKEVNGQSLLTQQKAIQVFKKVRKLKDVEIALLRNNRVVNLKYRVK